MVAAWQAAGWRSSGRCLRGMYNIACHVFTCMLSVSDGEASLNPECPLSLTVCSLARAAQGSPSKQWPSLCCLASERNSLQMMK